MTQLQRVIDRTEAILRKRGVSFRPWQIRALAQALVEEINQESVRRIPDEDGAL